MRLPPEFLRSCASPVDLAHAAGVELPSPAFEAFLDAAAGATLTRDQTALLAPLCPRGLPLSAAARNALSSAAPPKHVVNCSGRGSWKSTAGSWLSLFHAACVDHDEHAQRGTRVYCVHVAPTRRQAAEIVRQVRANADAVGIPHLARDAGGESTEIVLTNHWGACERVISVWPASASHGRGFATCFVHFAEHGHWRSGELHLDTDRAINQALAPRLGQFPRAQVYSESTPGPPRGLFFDWVTSPPRGAFLVRGSTMQWNPKAREEDLRAHVPDPREFAQEILASRFGLHGDGLLDAAACEAAIDRTGEITGARYAGVSQVLALDVAHGAKDGMAFVRVAATARDVGNGKHPIRGVVVTHVERWQGSRDKPLSNREIVRHAIAISKDAGGCPIVCDQHYFLTIADLLREAGYSEAADLSSLRGRRFMRAPMTAAAQTSRFRLLREVVHGENRLAIPDTKHGRALVSELSELRAWEMSGGLMKVEGLRTDDLADAIALACEVAILALPPSPIGSEGLVEKVIDSITHGHGGIDVHAHWVRRLPNGRELPAEPPEWSDDWLEHVVEAVQSGEMSPRVLAWLDREGHPFRTGFSLTEVPRLRQFIEERERLRLWVAVNHG